MGLSGRVEVEEGGEESERTASPIVAIRDSRERGAT